MSRETVHIKSPAEIELMRESGRLLAKVFKHLDSFVKEDVTTEQCKYNII